MHAAQLLLQHRDSLMSSFTPPSDYVLKQLLAEDTAGQRWLAGQTAMQRDVVIEVASTTDLESRQHFIATARAKAAAVHPVLASIYEAIDEQDVCFFVREWLPGRHLETLISEAQAQAPLRLAAFLRRLAEVQLHLWQSGIAQAPLHPRHVYLDDDWNLRLSNLIRTGDIDAAQQKADIISIATALRGLVASSQPGATRMTTLLGWMTSPLPEHIHSWQQVCDYAKQIEQQLQLSSSQTHKATLAPTPSKSPTLSGNSRWLFGAAGVALFFVAGFILWRTYSGRTTPADEDHGNKVPLAIALPAGSYRNPDGSQQPLKAFWLSTHEVTIGEYAEFLDTLAGLNIEQRRLFDHAEQPKEKTSHAPREWNAIWQAAQQSTTWQGRPLQRDCPIFGIDWWDAYAYCDWRRGRLPTAEEWHAALFYQCAEPQKLPHLPWGTVFQLDRHPAGFLGLLSGVSEWTSAPRVNPNNPLGEQQWVIIGSNSLNPQLATQRRWVADRSIQLDDTGLRVAFDQAP